MLYIDIKELNKDSFILDVRTKEEVSSIYLATLPFVNENSETIDIKKFIKKYNLIDQKTTINILCYSGKRAKDVADKFIKFGYDNVKVIKGGIIQAEKNGIQIIKK